MKNLLFGTAGIPISTKPPNTANGIMNVKSLGLGAMELEFVRSINIRPEKAPEIRRVSEEHSVLLTCHAPYYINLNAVDPEKIKASVDRILNSARITAICGGWSVCFHAGYYMKMPENLVYDKVRNAIESIVETLKLEDDKVWIRPEIGGKISSWGSLEEIIRISEEFEQVLPCIDWAHLYARTRGKINNYEEFRNVLERLEKRLGKDAINNMHMHCEGIEFGKAGEKKHKNLEESNFNYRDLLKALKDFSVKGVLISESPNIESDALLMQKEYNNL